MNGCRHSYSEFKINLDNLQYNIKKIREYVNTEIILVIKNNAYGYGAVGIGLYAQRFGIKKLAVISLSEAAELKENGINIPIIIMGKMFFDELKETVKLGFEPTIFELKEINEIEKFCKKTGKKATIHINIETGMNRLGVDFETAKSIIKAVEKSNYIKIGGIYSHFSTPIDKEYSSIQIENFKRFTKNLEKKYPLHLSNSVPSLLYPSARYDGVRIGILSYGIDPSGQGKIELKKVGTLKSKVIRIINVKKGESVGYDRKFKAKEDSKIAILQIGYGDGLPYRLNHGGKVFINGNHYDIVGSVCMDHIFVKVDEKVNLLDDAEIFGENINIEELAATCETIPYDISVKIGYNIPRVYTKEGKEVLKIQDNKICYQ